MAETAINYVVGDATEPQGDGLKVVCHCCNSIGGWGAGFVVALSKKSKMPEVSYRKWYKDGFYETKKAGKVPFELGMMQFAPFAKDVIVCNIIGQEGIGFKNNVPPIRYNAISDGLDMMRYILNGTEFSVHMPRMGCGLAGGNWDIMEKIIESTVCNHGINVTVYDFPV